MMTQNNIRSLDQRLIPVKNIVESLKELLKDAEDGKIRAFAFGIVEGDSTTSWKHAADLDSQEELRLLKLLLHPIGELELDVRARLRESCEVAEERDEDL